jgi:hypothetical protein
MGLLDISGFFTGLIINLLLITLVCYYFKRKYENIEEAQMEQAKILYELLQNNKQCKLSCDEKQCKLSGDISKLMSDSDDDSDESSLYSEDESEDLDELIPENIKEIHIEEDSDYNKMSVKTLRDLLTNKGIKTNNKMKKNELIRLVSEKPTLVVDLAFQEDVLDVSTELSIQKIDIQL